MHDYSSSELSELLHASRFNVLTSNCTYSFKSLIFSAKKQGLCGHQIPPTRTKTIIQDLQQLKINQKLQQIKQTVNPIHWLWNITERSGKIHVYNIKKENNNSVCFLNKHPYHVNREYDPSRSHWTSVIYAKISQTGNVNVYQK